MKKIIIFCTMIFSLFFIVGCSSQNNTGTLQVKLTDAPGDIENMYVTISKVAVNKNDDPDVVLDWEVISNETKTYDLLKLTNNVTAVLGEKKLEVGNYSQMRFFLDDASIVVDGETINLKVPPNKIKLVKGFEIKPGETTNLIIDFDVNKSLVKQGNGRYSLKPTIKIVEN